MKLRLVDHQTGSTLHVHELRIDRLYLPAYLIAPQRRKSSVCRTSTRIVLEAAHLETWSGPCAVPFETREL